MIGIRPAGAEDFNEIVGWNREMGADFLYQWAGKTAYQYPLTADQMECRSKMDQIWILTAYDGEEIVGTIELDQTAARQNEAHICRFLLSDCARGRGIGALILNEVTRMAFETMGIKKLTLNVYCFNAGAVRCYEKCGFLVKEYHAAADNIWSFYTMEKRIKTEEQEQQRT